MTWSVDFWESTATRENATVRLAGCELEVFTALALTPGVGHRIAAMLRPDAERNRANASLKVFVHRLRARMGREIIESSSGCYRLADGVSFDVASASRRFAQWRSARVHRSDAETGELIDLARRIRRIEDGTWEWFAPYRARLKESARSFALLAARCAGTRGDYDLQIAILGDLLTEDAGDDEARELTIRANLAAGRQSAAFREYRMYVAQLRDELGVLDAPAFAEFAG